MKIRDMLQTIIAKAASRGTFATQDLIRQARAGSVTGIAMAGEDGKELYLALVGGEADGAIYIDDKGELYGDKAAMLIRGNEQFTLYEVDREIIDAVVMGCRVFDKTHLRANTASDIPEFGTRSSGIGNLSLVITQNGEAQNGIRVSIRKDGKIVGSDFTTNDGSVGFRVMHGNYDCVLQDRNGMITTRRVKFDTANQKIILEL